MPKLRVHELVKQLNQLDSSLKLTSKKLLAALEEQGEFVKTASSTVQPPVVKKMKEYYGVADKSSGSPSSKSNPAAAAAAGSALRVRWRGPARQLAAARGGWALAA